MPAITTNGVTLYYEAYGKLSDGGTVFLIPGLGMQHWMWPDTLIETLVKGGAGVVVMDNRDCGRSSRCSGRVSMGRVPSEGRSRAGRFQVSTGWKRWRLTWWDSLQGLVSGPSTRPVYPWGA